MNRIPFLFLALVVSGAADAIVIRHDVPDGAYVAGESEFAALFGIYRTKAGHKDCVATLIAPRWAITASHCAKDESLVQRVAGNGYSVDIAGRSATIDRIVHHPGTGGGAPDVALLHFKSAVDYVAPVSLYRGRNETGQVVLIPGWGGTGSGKSGLTTEDGLFRVAENLVDRADEGHLSWKFDAPGPNSRALTLEGISGPGDSGGPALIRTPEGWSLAGISSSQVTMGGPEGVYGVTEIFVRVSDVADWVTTTISR